MKGITTYGFRGMHNLPLPAGKFMDDSRLVLPQIVLDADILDDGVVKARKGFRKIISLPGAHSVWHGPLTLCIATGSNGGTSLFQVGADRAVELVSVSGPARCSMDFLEAGAHVYLSNNYWKGRINLETSLVESWGLPLPLDPEITQGEGDLPPGTYKVCYTHFEPPGRLSGTGPLSVISFSGGTAGIKLLNRPPTALAWVTEPNGSELFLAPVDEDETISQPYFAAPLPTLGVQPPPLMSCLNLAFGRIWGAFGKRVYYSDEFQFEYFRPAGYLPVPEDVTLIAAINDGLFVNSLTTTWLFKGNTPGKMTLEKLGHGAIPGTLAWTMAEGGAYDPKKSRTVTPIWMSQRGMVVGRQSGVLVYLTQENLRINPLSRGAAFSRVINGVIPQTIFSLFGAPRGEFDQGLHEIFERGRIYIPGPLNHQIKGGVIIGGEGEYS